MNEGTLGTAMGAASKGVGSWNTEARLAKGSGSRTKKAGFGADGKGTRGAEGRRTTDAGVLAFLDKSTFLLD